MRHVLRFQRTHRLLTAAGHSHAKSWEILLDAVRGDAHAVAWIKTLFMARRH